MVLPHPPEQEPEPSPAPAAWMVPRLVEEPGRLMSHPQVLTDREPSRHACGTWGHAPGAHGSATCTWRRWRPLLGSPGGSSWEPRPRSCRERAAGRWTVGRAATAGPKPNALQPLPPSERGTDILSSHRFTDRTVLITLLRRTASEVGSGQGTDNTLQVGGWRREKSPKGFSYVTDSDPEVGLL